MSVKIQKDTLIAWIWYSLDLHGLEMHPRYLKALKTMSLGQLKDQTYSHDLRFGFFPHLEGIAK